MLRKAIIFAALLALPPVATTSAAYAGPHHAHYRAIPSMTGHQTEAPPWSFACIKDSGPTRCGEPMWVY